MLSDVRAAAAAGLVLTAVAALFLYQRAELRDVRAELTQVRAAADANAAAADTLQKSYAVLSSVLADRDKSLDDMRKAHAALFQKVDALQKDDAVFQAWAAAALPAAVRGVLYESAAYDDTVTDSAGSFASDCRAAGSDSRPGK